MKSIFYVLIGSLLIFACKSNRLATNEPFKDDVSIYRIKVVPVEDTTENTALATEEIAKNDTIPYTPIDPAMSVNYELDQASILLAQRNQKVVEERGILGYTIQVYSGTNRRTAEEIRDKLLLTYEEPTQRAYDRPNYKVKIGQFLSKMDAYELYLLIKDDYPQAFIVPELLKTDMNQYILEEEKN